MTLLDLEAFFVKAKDENSVWTRAVSFAEAQGVEFLCPRCFETNHGPVGTHMILCWFDGKVPADRVPGPGRWTPAGTGLDDLTLNAPACSPNRSVQITSGCLAHFHVTNGLITWA